MDPSEIFDTHRPEITWLGCAVAWVCSCGAAWPCHAVQLADDQAKRLGELTTREHPTVPLTPRMYPEATS